MKIWSNQLFGRNGRLFWLLFSVLFLPLPGLAILIKALLFDRYSLGDKVLIFGFFAFFSYVFCKWSMIVYYGSKTIIEIGVRNGVPVMLKTPLRSIEDISDVSVKYDVNGELRKKYLKLFYPIDGKHLVIHKGKSKYFMPSSTDGYSTLIEELSDVIRAESANQ